MKVLDPQGVEWVVRRRWLPWRRRVRDLPDVDVPDVGGDDLISALLLLVVAVVLVPLVILAVLLVAEVLLLLLLLPFVLLVQVLWRGGWPLLVERAGHVEHAENVRGWSLSGRRLTELAEQVRRGDTEWPDTAAWRGA